MAEGIKTRLVRTGQAEGILFSFKGRIGCTRDAQRLIRLAGRQNEEHTHVKSDKNHNDSEVEDLQTALVLELFRRHFEEDMDINDRSALAAVAEHVGMRRENVEHYLESNLDAAEVDLEAASARERGIVGVPHVHVTFSDGENHSIKSPASREICECLEVVEWLEVFASLRD